MPDLTKSEVLSALKKVDDAGVNKDLMMLNSIKSLDVKGNNLSITVSLSVPQSSVTEELKNKFKAALKSEFPSLENIDLSILPKVTSPQEEKKENILPGIKNTIAVASGKGGVGKSTVAVNLAVALAKDGAKVGLLDADIYGPSIPLMMGLTDKPKVYQDRNTNKIIPIEKFGIKLISMGLLVEDNAPVIWRGPMASGAVKQFMTDVDWGELDYLIFDLPPGTGDIQLTLVQTIPLTGAVIVTTPQEVSLIDARKALKMFTRVNVPVLGVVENMSYFIAPDTGNKYDIFGTGGGSKIASELEVPFLGGIPIDPGIRAGGDEGVPIVEGASGSEHADVIMEISRKMTEEVNIQNTGGNSEVEIILGDD